MPPVTAFNTSVARRSALNTHSLDALAEDGAAIKQELDPLVAQAMARSAEVRDRIKRLQALVRARARRRGCARIRCAFFLPSRW